MALAFDDDFDWAGFVHRCRSRLGMAQKNFAYKLEVSRETVSRWENGWEVPNPEAQLRLRRMAPMVFDASQLPRLIDMVDTTGGLATLLDADFRILRTSPLHQEMSTYDVTELYGRESERYWSSEMAQIIAALGGLGGYRDRGITRMDLKLEMIRRPGEPGYKANTKQFTFGSTITFGAPEMPIAYLTQVRIIEGGQPEPPKIRIGDGDLMAIA